MTVVSVVPEREVLDEPVTEFLGGEWVTYHPTRFEVITHEVKVEDEKKAA